MAPDNQTGNQTRSRKPDGQPAAPVKTRSKTSRVLGFFKPDFGTGPTQVREVHSTFLLILATLFASANVIDRDHPYLKAGAQFSLGDLFAATLAKIDWRDKQKLPQTVFFCAVWGLMASMVLYLITAVLLFVATPSHAYAQDTAAPTTATDSSGMFSVPDDDLAQQFLHNLVLGSPVDEIQGLNAGTTTDDVKALNNTGPIQAAFRSMLKYYSSVILIIASFMVLYHIIMLIVNSAWSGKPLEGANQIWGPLRLAIAIGLLVPLSNGLNSGQYIVLKAAEVGSSAGTKIWNIFTSSLNEHASQIQIEPTDAARDQFIKMVMVYTCMYDVDFHMQDASKWWKPNTIGNVTQISSPYGFNECGTITLPDSTVDPTTGKSVTKTDFLNATVLEQLSGKIREVTAKASADLRMRAKNTALRLVNQQYLVQTPQTPTDNQEPTIFVVSDNDQAPILDYAAQTIDEYYATTNKGISDLLKQNLSETHMQNKSWALAGAYYMEMAAYQSTVFTAARSTPMVTLGPVFGHTSATNTSADTSFENTISRIFTKGSGTDGIQEEKEFLSNYQKSFQKPLTEAVFHRRNPPSSSIDGDIKDVKDSNSELNGVGTAAVIGNGLISAVTMNPVGVASSIDMLYRTPKASPLSVAFHLDKFDFISAFSENVDDPFGSFINVGHKILSYGVDALIAGLALLATGEVQGLIPFISGGAAATAALAGWIMTISFYVISLGMLLCVLFPLVPVMKFLGGVVTWMLSIMEAIIGMPLFALAHLTPGGNGLLDPARQGYVMIFHIAIRPMLLVFGMIVSIIIVSLALFLLNAMFIPAMNLAWRPDDGGLVLALVMLGVWGVLAYGIVKKVFGYMDYISHSTMRWLGGGGYEFQRYRGEENALQAAVAFQQVSGMANNILGGISGGSKNRIKQGAEERRKYLNQEDKPRTLAGLLAKNSAAGRQAAADRKHGQLNDEHRIAQTHALENEKAFKPYLSGSGSGSNSGVSTGSGSGGGGSDSDGSSIDSYMPGGITGGGIPGGFGGGGAGKAATVAGMTIAGAGAGGAAGAFLAGGVTGNRSAITGSSSAVQAGPAAKPFAYGTGGTLGAGQATDKSPVVPEKYTDAHAADRTRNLKTLGLEAGASQKDVNSAFSQARRANQAGLSSADPAVKAAAQTRQQDLNFAHNALSGKLGQPGQDDANRTQNAARSGPNAAPGANQTAAFAQRPRFGNTPQDDARREMIARTALQRATSSQLSEPRPLNAGLTGSANGSAGSGTGEQASQGWNANAASVTGTSQSNSGASFTGTEPAADRDGGGQGMQDRGGAVASSASQSFSADTVASGDNEPASTPADAGGFGARDASGDANGDNSGHAGDEVSAQGVQNAGDQAPPAAATIVTSSLAADNANSGEQTAAAAPTNQGAQAQAGESDQGVSTADADQPEQPAAGLQSSADQGATGAAAAAPATNAPAPSGSPFVTSSLGGAQNVATGNMAGTLGGFSLPEPENPAAAAQRQQQEQTASMAADMRQQQEQQRVQAGLLRSTQATAPAAPQPGEPAAPQPTAQAGLQQGRTPQVKINPLSFGSRPKPNGKG